MNATRREFLLVGLFFTILAIVSTWPLTRHLTTHVIGRPMEARLSQYPELELEEDLGSASGYRLNWDSPALPTGTSR